ncbi:Sensors of blue-light using FAD [Mucilaginibacter pineti]|uniref:Sensors of blue-light using FAD n=2 Tax=Mucilaginibacter pineti TaxID=1391627 RepID=A0A1G7H9B0_9SPHI|nr:Sensors of blue-light using FAD [Mucilaginibacter pineti]
MTEEKLTLLLKQSRQKNSKQAITGLLLYMEGRFLDRMEGRFIQLLEGQETAVRDMYAQISTDDRHRNILLLNTGNCTERNFPDWTMGFRSPDLHLNETLAGFLQLDDIFGVERVHPRPAGLLNYFRSFYEINQVDGLTRRHLSTRP